MLIPHPLHDVDHRFILLFQVMHDRLHFFLGRQGTVVARTLGLSEDPAGDVNFIVFDPVPM